MVAYAQTTMWERKILPSCLNHCLFFGFLKIFKFFPLYLFCSVLSIFYCRAKWPNHTHIYVLFFFFTLSSITFHHKWLDVVLCALQQDPTAYLLQIQQFASIFCNSWFFVIADPPISWWRPLFFFFFSFFLGLYPGPMEVQGRIRAASASLHHSHSNAGSLTHWVKSWIKPTSSWILIMFLFCWATIGTPWWKHSCFFLQQPLVFFLGHFLHLPLAEKTWGFKVDNSSFEFYLAPSLSWVTQG